MLTFGLRVDVPFLPDAGTVNPALRAMRRVLVDYARRYGALQRGGGLRREK
jgi:hypothetical protein